MNNIIKLISILLITLLVIYCMFIQFEFFNIDNEEVIPNVGRALLMFILVMIYINIHLIYLREWTKVCKRSILRDTLKYFVFPYCCVFLPFGYSHSEVLEHEYILPPLILMYLMWVIVVNSWIKFSEEYAPLGLETKILFSHYPPLTRSDIIGMDIVIFVAFLFPLLFG